MLMHNSRVNVTRHAHVKLSAGLIAELSQCAFQISIANIITTSIKVPLVCQTSILIDAMQ